MLIWVKAMARNGGGGRPIVTYSSVFFHWICFQLLMVEDYTYVRVEFNDDLDLPFPKGDQWDDGGRKNTILCVFLFYVVFHFFVHFE